MKYKPLEVWDGRRAMVGMGRDLHPSAAARLRLVYLCSLVVRN